MTGSTKIKKAKIKPEVPQSVIDTWLSNHPDVNVSGFTFSSLKDLKLTGSTKQVDLSGSTKQLTPTNKEEIYNLIKRPKQLSTGNTFSFSSLTQSSSFNPFTGNTNISQASPNMYPSSGHTGPHRVKTPIVSLSGGTPTPKTKSLSISNQLLGSPSVTFTAGTVDTSFPYGADYGFDDQILDIIVQPDGKILVAGYTYQYYYYDGDSYPMQGLIRLNADGTVDENFSIIYNEDCYGGGFNGSVYTIALQPDGKILVGGGFNYFDRNGNCNNANYIIRLNSDGSRDNTFNTGDGFNDEVYDIVVQDNGKILVCGYFDYYNNVESARIIRLNANGSIDSSFNIGGSSVLFNDYVNQMVLLSDGKILCGGYFTQFSGISQNYITRLNSNGTLDTTFQIGNGFNDEVNSIALQSDGKIIVGGYFDTFNNNNLFNGQIVRLDTDGSLDTIFDYGLDSYVQAITIQPDDKILVGGNFGTYFSNLYPLSCDELIRFNADCSFDYSFYYEELFNDVPQVIKLQSDGKILIGGSFNDGNDPDTYPLNYFGRLNNSIQKYPYVYLGWTNWCFGASDGGYVTVGSTTPPVYSISGPENVYSFKGLTNPSQTAIGLAMIDGYPNNIIDFVQENDYGVNGCNNAAADNFNNAVCFDVFNGIPEPMTLAVDKKFIVGDIGFIEFNYNNEWYIHSTYEIVYISSGDTGDISPFTGIQPYITYSSVEESVRANGQYVAIDDCNAPCGGLALTHQYNIITDFNNISFRNCTDCGTVDFPVSFFDDGGLSIPYYVISGGTPIIQSTKTWNSCEECLIADSPKGDRNYNFYDGGISGDQVYTIVEQPDGKLLVGGNFNTYDGDQVNNFMRLNSDGSLDYDFFNNQGDGFSNYVRAIALQSDGKILVGGNFNYYNEELARKIIRLNSDGTIDNSFTWYDEFNGTVRAIAIQSNGKILVGGDFDYYYDYYCPGIIRLNTDGSPDSTFVIGDGFSNSVFSIVIETEIIRGDFSYNNGSNRRVIETILVGGRFSQYDGHNTALVARLKSDGTFINSFGDGFVDGDRVFGFKRQPDGKLLVWGGFYYYNSDYTPYNLARLNADYTLDTSFIGRISDDGGGFNDGYVVDVQLLPNGKMFVGGNGYSFADKNDYYNNTGSLVKLNSDGTLDDTFTYIIDDDNVDKVLLLSNKTLLVGGWFEYPTSKLLNLYIGEDFGMRVFNTCDGNTANIYLPSTFVNSAGGSPTKVTQITYESISTSGLDLIVDGNYDDDYWEIGFPSGFSIDFLNTNYTSVNVSSNPYITFGDPNNGSPSACCFNIPEEIPADVELPGVFLSFACPSQISDYDADLFQLYTGLTDADNTLVIKYVGSDHCDDVEDLIYGFKFYKNNPDYFDLTIEANTQFYENNPTGGISDGISTSWQSTFNSGPLKSYRIGKDIKTIKADINTSSVTCGTVGDYITTPVSSSLTNVGGSMYFDGNNNSVVTVDYNVAMDLDFSSWTIEWFQYFTSTQTCCLRVFDIGSFNQEHVGVSMESNQIVVWLEAGNSGSNWFVNLDTPVNDVWCHFAITAEDIGEGSRTIRVFQNGLLLDSWNISFDLNNFDGPTQLPLTIGGMGNGNDTFEGYITNFRWNKGNCDYTSNFTVPTSPLSVNGAQLLLLATNSNDLFIDSSNTQTISANNVTWSSNSPFGFPVYYTSTNTDTVYESCNSCTETDLYTTLLYVYGVTTPYIYKAEMKLSDIQKVQTFGPLFTTGGIEAYEILKYYK